MRTPCEWTVQDYLPNVRAQVILKLQKLGKTQKEISQMLNVSQPRINQYLKEVKVKKIKKIKNETFSHSQSTLMHDQLNETITEVVEKVVDHILNGQPAPMTIPLICQGCRELRMGSALCSIHLQEYSDLGKIIDKDKNCDLCLKWKIGDSSSIQSFDSLSNRFDVLTQLENLANFLLLKMEFDDFIPQIGAQLCMIYSSINTSDQLRNIAAFPGRIIKYQSQVKVVSRPEFFSSKTTGQFLINVRKLHPSISTVLSIKNLNEKPFEGRLKDNSFTIFKTKEGDSTGFINQLPQDVTLLEKIAVLDSGSFGYESIAYLFVKNPNDLLYVFD